ncbi:MAG: outer membrane protein assembly factor BamE [Actinobacteria bacterium]|nr:outer membrane protein assembly factor BamE [Actinomycetota bacterium]
MTPLHPRGINAAAPGRRGLRAAGLVITVLALLIMAVLLVIVTGCGSEAGISQSQYEQVQKGMTLDQVEGLLGQPDRSHRTGPTNNPNIIWYYNKSEAEGLVRISFINALVDNLSPYDLSVNLDE